MNDIAIDVAAVGKLYKLGARESYRTLRDNIADFLAAPVRRFRSSRANTAASSFWALRDVSFSVRQGEVVGIIGRNGAGKSTLLKILSRITEPTEGVVKMRGRVGSLLEVGTGFHPELTGRENIYLNGAILGMRKAEIERKFSEIVAFAEVERFIDTPVKKYSSGMYVRLAFAVAAHLEPEILIVDEVLAVGDMAFQQKCLRRMGEAATEGRTVLFVSHNIAAIKALCNRCVLIESGRVVMDGSTDETLTRYLAASEGEQSSVVSLRNHTNRAGKGSKYMVQVSLASGCGNPGAELKMGESLDITVDFDSEGTPLKPVLGVVIKTILGTPVFGINNRVIPTAQRDTGLRRGSISCRFESLPLMPGRYLIDLYFGDSYRDLDVVTEAASFTVYEADIFGSGRIPPGSAGAVFWPAVFEITERVEPVSA